MTDEPLLDAIREIGVIHQGDTLILSSPHRTLTNDEAVTIRTTVERLLPGVNVVVIGLQVEIKRGTPITKPPTSAEAFHPDILEHLA